MQLRRARGPGQAVEPSGGRGEGAAGDTQPAITRHPMPFTRVEIVVLGLGEDGLQVLLGRRARAPHARRWALPGGALRIDLDESLEAAARRVMRERLGRELPFLRQLCAVGGAVRDPRTPWALSVVYRALLPAGTRTSPLTGAPGKRIEALAWRPVEEAMADSRLAFDHSALISQAVTGTRGEVDGLDLPGGFVPEQFTLGELQTLCEQVLGRRLDKSSFRRRLADRAVVEPVTGATRKGANRPAQIYRLRTG